MSSTIRRVTSFIPLARLQPRSCSLLKLNLHLDTLKLLENLHLDKLAPGHIEIALETLTQILAD